MLTYQYFWENINSLLFHNLAPDVSFYIETKKKIDLAKGIEKPADSTKQLRCRDSGVFKMLGKSS